MLLVSYPGVRLGNVFVLKKGLGLREKWYGFTLLPTYMITIYMDTIAEPFSKGKRNGS